MSRPVADTPPFMARMIVGLVAAFIVIFLAWAGLGRDR
jgi:adhesin transport system membrane fusion protein